MKKILVQVSIILLVSVVCSLVLNKSNIKVCSCMGADVAQFFFTAISILFSVGLSIIIGLDFSDVVNERKRKLFLKNAEQVIFSFCAFFILDCMAVFLMTIGKTLFLKYSVFQFLTVFLFNIILFSVFYFVLNLKMIYNFKRDLEDVIFQEKK